MNYSKLRLAELWQRARARLGERADSLITREELVEALTSADQGARGVPRRAMLSPLPRRDYFRASRDLSRQGYGDDRVMIFARDYQTLLVAWDVADATWAPQSQARLEISNGRGEVLATRSVGEPLGQAYLQGPFAGQVRARLLLDDGKTLESPGLALPSPTDVALADRARALRSPSDGAGATSPSPWVTRLP